MTTATTPPEKGLLQEEWATPELERATSTLNQNERGLLKHLEGVIDTNLRCFNLAFNALLEVQERILYRETHPNDWDGYLRERWSITRQRFHQLRRHAEIQESVSTMVDAPDLNERQAREIGRVSPELRPHIIAEARFRSPEGGEPTAKIYREVVEESGYTADAGSDDEAERTAAFLRNYRDRKAAGASPALTLGTVPLRGQQSAGDPSPMPPAAKKKESHNEWYTPSRYVDAGRRVLGAIDLDPASCARANETVKASIYWTKADDGLKQPWNIWKTKAGRTCLCSCHKFNARSAGNGSQEQTSISLQSQNCEAGLTQPAGSVGESSQETSSASVEPTQSSGSDCSSRSVSTDFPIRDEPGSGSMPRSITTSGASEAADYSGTGPLLNGEPARPLGGTYVPTAEAIADSSKITSSPFQTRDAQEPCHGTSCQRAIDVIAPRTSGQQPSGYKMASGSPASCSTCAGCKPTPSRLWLNSPYGRDEEGGSGALRWVNHVIAQYRDGIATAAIICVNSLTYAPWFRPLYDFPICFVDHRVKFECGVPREEPERPSNGTAFIYLGPDVDAFIREFSEFGAVVQRLEVKE
jgi:hypothetical protein